MAGEGGTNLGTATGYIEIRDNVDAAVRNAQSAFDRAITGMTGRMQSFGDTLTGIGAKMLLITAPLMVGMQRGVGAALVFEESMANVAAVLGLSADETAALSARLLEMGGQTRAGPQAIADAYYEIAGGVADASTHMAILEAAIAASEAGNADLAGTTNALIAVMNSYGLSAEQAGMVSDVLTRTVGAGVGSMDEFGQALGLTAGIAAANGVELDALGGSLAYITTQGVSASEAGTQVTAIISAMLNPNEKMKDAFKELGWESGQAALEMYGLAGVTGRLEHAFGQDALAPMLGNLNALRGATALNQAGFEEFIGTFEDTVAGATEAARAIQNMSRKAKIDKFRAQIDRLAITFGESLFPAIDTAINALTPFIDGMIKWVSENPEIVSQIALLVAAIAGIGTVAVVVGVVISTLGGLLAVLLSPIGLLIGGLAALAMAWQNNVLGIQTFVERIRDGFASIDLSGVVQPIIDAFNNLDLAGIAQSLSDGFSAAAQSLSDGLSAAFASLSGMDMTPVSTWLNDNFQAVADTAVSLASVVFGGPFGAALGIGSLIQRALESDFLGLGTLLEQSGIRASVANAFNAIQRIIQDVVNAIFGGTGAQPSGVLQRIATDISNALGLIRDVATTIGTGISNGIRALGEGIQGFASAIAGIDADNLYTFLRPFGAVLAGVALGAGTLIGAGVELVLTGLGEALRLLGEGVSQLVTSGAALMNGDLAGALANFGAPALIVGVLGMAFAIPLITAAIGALAGVVTFVLSTSLGLLAVALGGVGLIVMGFDTGRLELIGLGVGALGVAAFAAFGTIGLLGVAIGGFALLVARLLPGIVESWGAAFDQIKQFIQNVINKVDELLRKIGEAVRSIPGMQDSPADTAEQGVNRMKEMGLFATGGYTGDGPANEVAGLVHRGEWVFNRQQMGGLMGMLAGGGGGGRKIADTIIVNADTREGGYAAAAGFEDQVQFMLRS